MKIVKKSIPELTLTDTIPLGTVVSIDGEYYIIVRKSLMMAQLSCLATGVCWDYDGLTVTNSAVQYQDLLASVGGSNLQIMPEDAVELHVECAG